jgi:hypothetical protein
MYFILKLYRFVKGLDTAVNYIIFIQNRLSHQLNFGMKIMQFSASGHLGFETLQPHLNP